MPNLKPNSVTDQPYPGKYANDPNVNIILWSFDITGNRSGLSSVFVFTEMIPGGEDKGGVGKFECGVTGEFECILGVVSSSILFNIM